MTASQAEIRWSPAIILLLLAALVAVSGLWVVDRAQRGNAAVAGVPAEVAGGDAIEWKMVTTWPKNFPGLGTAANEVAQAVTSMSGGRLTVQVYGAGDLVPGRPRKLKARELTELHEGVAVADAASVDLDAHLPRTWLRNVPLVELEGPVCFPHDHCFHLFRLSRWF